MSRTFTSNNKSNNTIQKYCKICHDMGKSESEYRSHFTRETKDPNSKILCPTLLAMECRYCYKKGHTVKYCTLAKKNEKNKIAETRIANNTMPKPVTNITNAKNVATNKFAQLSDDDSDNEEIVDILKQSEQIKEEFPALCSNNVTIRANTAKPANVFNFKAALESEYVPPPAPKTTITTPLFTTSKPKQSVFEMDWAAMDSDDDDSDSEIDLDSDHEFDNDEDKFSDRTYCWSMADKHCRDDDW